MHLIYLLPLGILILTTGGVALRFLQCEDPEAARFLIALTMVGLSAITAFLKY